MRRATAPVWTDRGDGSLWATCRVGGELAVLAIVEDGTGKLTSTAIVQVGLGNVSSFEDAKLLAEQWLQHARAVENLAAE